MKRIFILLAAVAVLASCGPKYSGSRGEKTQKDAEAEFVSSLTQSDQDAVLALADECMGKLKDGRVDEALDMIYVLYNDVLTRSPLLILRSLSVGFSHSRSVPLKGYIIVSLLKGTMIFPTHMCSSLLRILILPRP